MFFEIQLKDFEKMNLLSLARKTIEFYLTYNKIPTLKDFNIELPEIINEHLGIFVSLHRKGELRGCIGYVRGYTPLSQGIIENAINAATRDPRFDCVSVNELNDIKIEISVLSPISEVSDIKKIKIGSHGLIISKGTRCGLLLPQVASEYKWTREKFLEHTCLKAGLNKDAWKGDSKIEYFSALVFSEK